MQTNISFTVPASVQISTFTDETRQAFLDAKGAINRNEAVTSALDISPSDFLEDDIIGGISDFLDEGATVGAATVERGFQKWFDEAVQNAGWSVEYVVDNDDDQVLHYILVRQDW